MFRTCTKDLRVLKVTGIRGTDFHGTSSKEHFSQATSSKSTDHYRILGLATNSTQKDIKQAYYRLSKVYHPDVNKSATAGQQFQMISDAYEVLGNEGSRKLYDVEMGIIRGERPVRHGQQKYRPRGTPPTGMSSVYNFDEWYKEHYTSTFERGQSDRKKAQDHHTMKEEMKQAYNADPAVFKMDDMTKTVYFLTAVATIAFVLKIAIKRMVK